MPICDSSAGVRFGSSTEIPTHSFRSSLSRRYNVLHSAALCRSRSDVPRAARNKRFSCAARSRRLIHCLIRALLGRFDSRCHRRLFSCRRASLLCRTATSAGPRRHSSSLVYAFQHPSLCGLASAPTCATQHPSQSSKNPNFASSSSRRL